MVRLWSRALLVVLWCTLAGLASAKANRRRAYDWYAARPIRRFSVVVSTTTLYADCNPLRDASVINGSMPGPVLRARAGERLLVNVTNAMTDQNTTIHWHGLSMYLNPASDGTPMISQWPIAPGNWFEYDIRLPDWEHGTYFYHAHVHLQSMTTFGPLIIEDALPPGEPNNDDTVDLDSLKGKSVPGAPYTYDEDRVLALGDYFPFKTQKQLMAGLQGDPFAWPGNAHSLLINGKQMGTCNRTAVTDPTLCDAEAATGCGFEEIHVDPEKTYRFRLIGAMSLHYQGIKIIGHDNLTLIEADGSYLQSLTVNHVEVAAGQRYSFLLKTKTCAEVLTDASGGVYWIRVEPRWRGGPSGWAKLVYDGCDSPAASNALAAPPSTIPATGLLPAETNGWIVKDLQPHPTDEQKCPDDSEVTRMVIINAQQTKFFTSKTGVRWTDNADVYDEDTETMVPYLIGMLLGNKEVPSWSRAEKGDVKELLRDTSGADDLVDQKYDPKTDVFLAKAGEVVDIVIINRPSELSAATEIHPWHMHSSKHFHVASGNGTFSIEAYREARKQFPHPVPRDTTTVFPSPGPAYLNQSVSDPNHNDGGWSVIRYKVSDYNAGLFPLHCHLAFHLAMGMAVVWGLALDHLRYGPLADIYSIRKDGKVQGLSAGYLEFGHNVSAVDF